MKTVTYSINGKNYIVYEVDAPGSYTLTKNDDLVNVTSSGVNLTLDKGKDTVTFGNEGVSLKINDYTFGDDVICIDTDGGINRVSLNADGKITASDDYQIDISDGVIHDVYYARTTEDITKAHPKTTVYATATTNEDVVINASEWIDDNIVINASASKNANIILGSSTANYIITMGSGTDNILNFSADTDFNKLEFSSVRGSMDCIIDYLGTHVLLKNYKINPATIKIGNNTIFTDYDKDNIITLNNSLENSNYENYNYILSNSDTTINISGDGYFEYSNDFNNHTSLYAIKAIDSSNMHTNSNVAISDVADVSTGAGTNIIWGYTQKNTQINLKKNAGNDYIVLWNSVDNDVKVNNFDTENDTLFLYGSGIRDNVYSQSFTTDIVSIAKNFNFSINGSDIIVQGSDSDTKMTIENAVTTNSAVLSLYNGANMQFKGLVGTEGNTIEFISDVRLYAGASTVASSLMDSENTYVIYMNENELADTDNSYIFDNNIKTFDASASNAKYDIVGSASSENIIKGGKTNNILYGGGSFDDTIYGNIFATDTYKWGNGDGNDIIADGVDNNDTISFYNITDLDSLFILTVGTDTIIKNSTDSLTLKNISTNILSSINFFNSDNIRYYYDCVINKFVKY